MRRPMTSEADTFWGGRNAKFSSEPQRVWFERMRDKGWTSIGRIYGGGSIAPSTGAAEEMAAWARAAVEFYLDARPALDTATRRRRRASAKIAAANPVPYSGPNAGSTCLAANPRRERWRRLSAARRSDVIRELRRLDLLLVRTDPRRSTRHQLHSVRHGRKACRPTHSPDLRLFAIRETFFDNVRRPLSEPSTAAGRRKIRCGMSAR
jgi:hypothetical protein